MVTFFIDIFKNKIWRLSIKDRKREYYIIHNIIKLPIPPPQLKNNLFLKKESNEKSIYNDWNHLYFCRS